MSKGKLVVVSNRLPVTVESRRNEKRLYSSSGGLVNALVPILKDSGGCWIGWTGTDSDETVSELAGHWASKQGYSLVPVFSLHSRKLDIIENCLTKLSGPCSTA